MSVLDALLERFDEAEHPRGWHGRWESAPGGKRYTTEHRGHQVRIVKMNTAAGGPRWKAYRTNPRGEERVVAKGDKLAAVKSQAGDELRSVTAPKAVGRAPATYAEGLRRDFRDQQARFREELHKMPKQNVGGVMTWSREQRKEAERRAARRVAEAAGGVLGTLVEAFSVPGVSVAQLSQTHQAGLAQQAAAGAKAKGRTGRKTAHAAAGSGHGGQFIGNGSSGAPVQGVQRKVGVPVSGKYDARTANAVRSFQQAHGLQVDGVVGRQTAAAMRGNGNAKTVAPGALSATDTRGLTQHGARARSSRSRVTGQHGKRKGAAAPMRMGGGVVV